jgi:hypothetical protein
VPVDTDHRREPGPGTTVGVLPEPAELDSQRHRPGEAADREVAVDENPVAVRVDTGGRNVTFGVGRDVEEVAAAQVVVSGVVAGVDRGQVDLGFGVRVKRIFCRGDGRGLAGEGTAHRRHHHVPDSESNLGMDRVGVQVPTVSPGMSTLLVIRCLHQTPWFSALSFSA